jgi:hypothetical protein
LKGEVNVLVYLTEGFQSREKVSIYVAMGHERFKESRQKNGGMFEELHGKGEFIGKKRSGGDD